MEAQNYSCSNKEILKHPQVAVLMVPFPAQGHLNQLLHLSHLIASYGLPVHYAGSSAHNRQAKLRLHGWHPEEQTLGNKIQFHDFELPPYDSPPPNPDPCLHFPGHLQPLWDASMHLREPISQLIRQLSSEFRRVVVVHDILMSSVVQDFKLVPDAESYVFIPCSAFRTFLNMYDSLNKKLPFELNANCDDILPKCSTLPNEDGCFTSEFVTFRDAQLEYMGSESGRLYDTSRVIEGRYVELVEKLCGKKCYAIGPFNPVQIAENTREMRRHMSLEWLDRQEVGSVIYVSFGTVTSINDEQITDLAVGLERSGQKFVWVLRDADGGDVFAESGAFRRPRLPEGYEERVRSRGMVVREWAPQLEILAHQSTGGFMSHCGWNSCMESISMGVPIATWPMHSDQPRNAVLVTEVLRIGVKVRDWAGRGELVGSSVVEDAVRRLMASEDGKEMRKRAAELGYGVRRSASPGGSSRLEMDSFIAHIAR